MGADRRSPSFFTTHAHVLMCIADEPDVRCRDIAARLGVTERAVQGIVADLVAHGYLERTRSGRRNHYEVRGDLALPDPLADHRVEELLRTFCGATLPKTN